MAKTLAEWRKEKKMKTGQLASKAGIPFADIVAYEKGKLIRLDHLSRLAKALYVSEMDILLEPPPKPKPVVSPAAKVEPPAERLVESATAVAPPPPPRKKSRWQKHMPSDTEPARESQIVHLLALANKQGEDETAVAAKIGKLPTELTEYEASYWLKQYTESLKAYKATRPQPEKVDDDTNRPPDTRRQRHHLPEGVDEFEMNYLQARQEAADMVAFTLFNGQQFQGKIIGFSPYQIAIQQADDTEMMLHKLAIAYYTVIP